MKCFYLWNMNLKETKIPNPYIHFENAKIYPDYKVLGPQDILPLVKRFSSDLSAMWDHIPHWVIQSDIARLLYIYYHGGMYLDCDCIIKKKIDSTAPLVLFIEAIVPIKNLGPRECKHPDNATRIANYAFISTEVENPFLNVVLLECIRRLHLLPSKITNEDILWCCGPDVITSMYHLQKPTAVLLDKSYLNHLCHGTWR